MGIPQSVMMATNLMLATLALGLINFFLNIGSMMSQSALGGTFALIIGLCTFAVFAALMFGLVTMIRKRKNWARIVYLVLVGIGILMLYSSLKTAFGMSTIGGVVSVINTLLQLAAAWLLIQRPSSNWFKGAMA